MTVSTSLPDPTSLPGRDHRRRSGRAIPRPDVWAFLEDPATKRLPASSRALLQAVKDEREITKVIIGEDRYPDFGGRGIQFAPSTSPQARELLLSAGRILRPRSERGLPPVPAASPERLVLGVRDGLAMTRPPVLQGSTSGDDVSARHKAVHQAPESNVNAVLAASRIDALIALTAWPTTYTSAWRTGLPAHDFLFCSAEQLPSDIAHQEQEVRGLLAGRGLVLVLPARPLREGIRRTPSFLDDGQWRSLLTWCAARGLALGSRGAEDASLLHALADGREDVLVDVSEARIPELHAVLRAADLVVTDHADAAVDFAMLDRPTVSVVNETNAVADHMLIDRHTLFPGQIHSPGARLEEVLDRAVSETPPQRFDAIRTLLCERRDAQNSARVVERILTWPEEPAR